MRARAPARPGRQRSEEHTSELQSHSEISYAVFCLQKKKKLEPIHDLDVIDLCIENLQGVLILGVFQYLLPNTTVPICLSPFFFNDTATTEIDTLSYTLSLHDALPICRRTPDRGPARAWSATRRRPPSARKADRKSTRLNSSHVQKSRMPSSA